MLSLGAIVPLQSAIGPLVSAITFAENGKMRQRFHKILRKVRSMCISSARKPLIGIRKAK